MTDEWEDTDLIFVDTLGEPREPLKEGPLNLRIPNCSTQTEAAVGAVVNALYLKLLDMGVTKEEIQKLLLQTVNDNQGDIQSIPITLETVLKGFGVYDTIKQ